MCTNKSESDEILRYSSKEVDSLVKQMGPLAIETDQDHGHGVAIYGAGFVGIWAAQYLQSIGAKVTHFIDRDPKKAGTSILGIPVILPTDPTVSSNRSIYIAARHAVKDVLKTMGGKNQRLISFDGYYVVKNYLRFISVRDSFLCDVKSKETYNALMIAMLTGSTQSCRAVMVKDMYFGIPEFSGTFDETFLDAGAFVGDTVERFIWENMGTFRHIYAFEPGPRQFEAMQNRMARLSSEWAFGKDSFTLVKAGLASKDGRMGFTFADDLPIRHGLTSENTGEPLNETNSVEVYALDSFLQGKPVSMIKADIEGMEMELLKGAQETIRRYRPKMAICVYHYPSDLFEVAEYVRHLAPEYQFVLREHAPIFGDFVLYCFVE